MSFRIVAGVFAAIGLGACSLGGLDGFTSPGADGVPDAQDDAGGGPATDGSITPDDDASASADADAGTTLPDGSDGGRYCAAFTNEDLCADFDETNPLAFWTKTQVSTADISLVSTGALSAPNALRASLGASGANRMAFFNRDIGSVVVDRARLSYALFIEAPPTGDEMELNGVVFQAGSTAYEFYLALGTTGGGHIVEQVTAGGGEPQSNYHELGLLPSGQWIRFTLDVTLSGSGKELVLAIDGSERARKPLTLTAPGVPRVRTGITWADKTAANGVVLVDDVRFDVLP